MTNGTIPMGGVAVRSDVHDAIMQGPIGRSSCSTAILIPAHPAACARADRDPSDLRARSAVRAGRELETYWQDAVHMLRQAPNVVDVRNIGLVGGVELKPLKAGRERGVATSTAAPSIAGCWSG